MLIGIDHNPYSIDTHSIHVIVPVNQIHNVVSIDKISVLCIIMVYNCSVNCHTLEIAHPIKSGSEIEHIQFHKSM